METGRKVCFDALRLANSLALTFDFIRRYKSWKRRWFILNDNCLYYFEYTTDKEPRGIIPLENISVKFRLILTAVSASNRLNFTFRCEKFKTETNPIALSCTLVGEPISSKHVKQTLKER